MLVALQPLLLPPELWPELLLLMGLGFLGSFGHCLGMCGPITVALSLGLQDAPDPWQRFRFHLALNLGRLCSYGLVGMAIGGLGSVLVAGGALAGVGSPLRQGIAIATGLLLIAFGLRQVAPDLWPRLPLLHPLQGRLHQILQTLMGRVAQGHHWSTPLFLGLAWGLVPCGFLYAAQLQAAATSSPTLGGLSLLAFGTGTLPMMVGVGASSAWLSRDRASQLFRCGGWLTLAIGVLTLARTGDTMGNLSGYLALAALILALVARPLSRLWPGPHRYRRLIGVGAWVLAVIHVGHGVVHHWQWNLRVVLFMVPAHRWGIAAGAIALTLLLPLALTSFPLAQRRLGSHWRSLHLLSLPALALALLHWGWISAGPSQPQPFPLPTSTLLPLGAIALTVLAIRSAWVWQCLGLYPWYTPACPQNPAPRVE